MKNLLLIVLSSICVAACKPDYDTFEAEPIEGKVQITDPYTQNPPVIAAGAAVYLIAENSGEESYYYKTLTNLNGEFVFSHRPNGKSLCVRAELTKDSIKYVATALAINGLKNTPLKLMPQYPKGKIKVLVKDDKGQPINGVAVYLFVNERLAASVNDEKVGGEIRKKTTNNQGIAFFYGLEAGTYFVSGKRDKQVFGPSSLAISQNNFDNPTNYLDTTFTARTPTAPVILDPAVQLEVQVIDNVNDDSLYNMEVYLFSSQAHANTVLTVPVNKPLANWVTLKRTNEKGRASFKDLIVGKGYYVGVRDTTHTMKPVVHGSIVIAQAKVETRDVITVKMQR